MALELNQAKVVASRSYPTSAPVVGSNKLAFKTEFADGRRTAARAATRPQTNKPVRGARSSTRGAQGHGSLRGVARTIVP